MRERNWQRNEIRWQTQQAEQKAKLEED